MGLIPLAQAPPKLYELFDDSKTLEDKAFRFLETHYENGSYRRTSRVLKIDPKTVKSIYEFLLDTDVGQKFQALLIEQTEDFYSAKTLTSLFEGFQREIQRVEDQIKVEQKLVDADPKDTGAKTRITKLISEKRMWMSKLLDASLACKPVSKAVDTERKKDEIKQTNHERTDLLSDYGDSELN